MLAIYEAFDLDFNTDKAKKNAIADCPFCGDEAHFSVSLQKKNEGQYRCLKCGDTGNAYSFLQKMHARAYANTKPKNWKELSEQWGNDWKYLRDNNLAFDEDNNRWLVPVTNGNGSIANLMQWKVPEDGEKSPLMSTSGCELHLHFANEIKDKGPILVCEGYKDGLSLRELLTAAEVTDHSVVAVPGADVFKDEWKKYFKGRDVVLLYDNDAAGHRGADKALKLLTGTARSIRRITWPKGTADKYDIRDYINDTAGTPINVWKSLSKMFTSGKVVTRLVRTSFKQVVADFKKVIRVDSYFEDAMAIAFAVVFAAKIPGDPIWMLLVGPPGSGKSLLLKTFGSCEDLCEFLSKLTPTSFVSGFQTSDGTDLSLMARVQGKTLVIKDLTCLKSMPADIQEQVYGLLRDASDGRVDVPYGNQAPKVYKDVWFSILGGITDIIHGDNRSVMGERFLKLEFIDGANTDREAMIRAAMNNEIAIDPEKQQLVLDSVQAYLSSREIDLKRLPKLTKGMEDRLVALAQVVSYLRARVQRERGDLLYRPDREIGTRPGVQLKRIAQLLAFTYGSPINEKVYNLTRRVAIDTCTGWSLEIASALIESEKTRKPGMTTSQIAERIRVTSDFARKVLIDMQELGAVTRELEEQPDGEQRYRYFVSEDLLLHWRRAGLEDVKNLILVHHQPVRNRPRGKYSPHRKPTKEKLEKKLHTSSRKKPHAKTRLARWA